VRAGVDQATADLDRLVGGDAARDAEDDTPTRQPAQVVQIRLLGLGVLVTSCGRLLAGGDGHDLVVGDFLERDRERLA